MDPSSLRAVTSDKFADIVGPERLYRVDRQLPHLGERVAAVRLHQRRVDVLITHVGQAEHSPPKLEIAMQYRQAAIGLGDQCR